MDARATAVQKHELTAGENGRLRKEIQMLYLECQKLHEVSPRAKALAITVLSAKR